MNDEPLPSGGLGLVVDDVPVPADGPARARRIGTARVRRRRAAASMGVALLVVLVVVLALPGRNEAERVSTDPATTVSSGPEGPVVGPPLLDLSQEALDAQPVIPPGWKPVDHGLARIWVPGDWDVLTGVELAEHCGASSGATLVVPTGTGCIDGGPFVDLGGHTPCTGCTSDPVATRNGLTVTRWTGLRCSSCTTSEFVQELRVQVSGIGPELERILGTIGPSPATRALAKGPLVSTDGWQRVTVPSGDGSTSGTTRPLPPGEAALWVPGDWPVRDLRSSGPDDHRCDGVAIPTSPVVLIGAAVGDPTCPVPTEGGRSAGFDIVALPTHASAGPPVAQLSWKGRPASVVVGEGLVGIFVSTSEGDRPIFVGIGSDPAVARTILRTLSFA